MNVIAVNQLFAARHTILTHNADKKADNQYLYLALIYFL